jgi:multidrug efflux pump subunit AcrB
MARYLLRDTRVRAAHGGAGMMGAARGALIPVGMAMAHLHLKVEHGFERLRQRYLAALRWVLGHRTAVLVAFVLVLVSAAFVTPWVGQDFFPQVDAGQIRLHVDAPPGTRIEDTGVIFSQVQDEMRA